MKRWNQITDKAEPEKELSTLDTHMSIVLAEKLRGVPITLKIKKVNKTTVQLTYTEALENQASASMTISILQSELFVFLKMIDVLPCLTL